MVARTLRVYYEGFCTIGDQCVVMTALRAVGAPDRDTETGRASGGCERRPTRWGTGAGRGPGEMGTGRGGTRADGDRGHEEPCGDRGGAGADGGHDRVPAGEDRAVSNVLGVVLVVAVVLVGVASIVGFGVVGLLGGDLSETAVERDLIAFADALDRATVHGDTTAGHDTVELSTAGLVEHGDRLHVEETAGRFELRADGAKLLSEPLGRLEYEGAGEGPLAYQSGLVFAGSGAGTAVVRENAFDHRAGETERLSVHVTRTTGTGSLDRELVVETSSESRHRGTFLDPGTELLVRVESDYSRGWTRVLRTLLPDGATTTRRGETVAARYTVPAGGLFVHAQVHEVAIGGR